jgi:hypothetical protein
MDTLELIVSNGVADILINGQNLIDMLRQCELPFAEAEGHPSIAGGYMGLPSKLALLPSTHLIGATGKRTHLLVCRDCGEDMCWPFLADIIVTPTEVIWQNFSQPYRTGTKGRPLWSYEKFRPFRFDRQQYEEALKGKASH